MASKVEEEKSAASFFERQSRLFGAGFSFSGYERDLMCLNRGDGTFLDVSGVSGIDFIGDGRGAVFADFDNDGDTDVFLRALHGPGHLLFRNNSDPGTRFLRVALRGRRCGRDAFGATVRVKTSNGTLTQVKSGGAGFLSQSDPRLVFALGAGARAEWLEVTWPSGKKQRFEAPGAGGSVLVIEGKRGLQPVAEKRFALPDPESAQQVVWNSLRLRQGDAFPELALVLPGGAPAPRDAVVRPGAKLTLVNFWATWCVPCRREMPELERLAARGRASGLRVVGISVDDDKTRAKVADYARQVGVTYPVYVAADGGLQERIWAGKEAGVPLSIVLDADGRVVDAVAGWSPETRRRLEALLPAGAGGH